MKETKYRNSDIQNVAVVTVIDGRAFAFEAITVRQRIREGVHTSWFGDYYPVTVRTVMDYLTDYEMGANCRRFPYATAKMLAEGKGIRVLPCTALTADIHVARRIAQTYNELTNISDMMEVEAVEIAHPFPCHLQSFTMSPSKRT